MSKKKDSAEARLARLEARTKALLYTLLRDEVPYGRVNSILYDMRDATEFKFSSAGLDRLAQDTVEFLRGW